MPTDSSGKFEIDISLPPGIGVYSYYGSTSTHYFDIPRLIAFAEVLLASHAGL